MTAESLGRIITFLRKQNNWTQKELAQKLNISDKTVSKWETGSGLPDICFLPILADIFNVTVDFLVTTNADNYAMYESLLESYQKSNRAQNKITDNVVHMEQNFVEASSIDSYLFDKYDVQKGLRDIRGIGVKAGLTKISEVNGKYIENGTIYPMEGELFFRGFDVKDLVDHADKVRHRAYEESCYVLLNGKLPNQQELDQFTKTLTNYRTLPSNFVKDVILKSPTSDIMNSMAKSVLTLAAYDTKSNDISLENVMRQSLKLIAVFPMLAIYSYQAYIHYNENQSLIIHKPNPEYSAAENILYLLRPDGKFTDTEAQLLDAYLVLHAEHGGGNNSSFTTHVVTSTGTDTYSAIAAALCSLKGPKHGGANLKVVQMMDDLKKSVSDWRDENEVYNYLNDILDGKAFDGKGLIYGMGHAVYTLSDPRAVVLKEYIKNLAIEKGLEDEYKLYTTVADFATELIAKKRKIYKGVCPNVDFYSGFGYRMLGIPDELFTPLFAVSRVVGWSAHRMEELLVAGKIIRPQYIHVGTRSKYVPMNKRKK